jgi:hypothetical protein
VPDSNTVALASLSASLVGCLIWLLKYYASKTIPELQSAQAKQIERLCEAFREDSDANRRLTLRLHNEKLAEIERLARAVEANQLSLLTIIERTSANGSHLKLWRPPLGEASHLSDADPGDAGRGQDADA